MNTPPTPEAFSDTLARIPCSAESVDDLRDLERRLGRVDPDDLRALGQLNVDIERCFPQFEEDRPPRDAIFAYHSPEGDECCWKTGRIETVDFFGAPHEHEVLGFSPHFCIRFDEAIRIIPGDGDGAGWRFWLERQPGSGLWTATLRRHGRGVDHEGIALTAAVAICLAAIRAHIAEFRQSIPEPRA